MLWQGKPLEEYSKGELIAIIYALAKMQQDQYDRHMKDLDVLSGKDT